MVTHSHSEESGNGRAPGSTGLNNRAERRFSAGGNRVCPVDSSAQIIRFCARLAGRPRTSMAVDCASTSAR